VTLTFNLLTLLNSPNLDTLGLWVLELFAMYATGEQTKATLIAPFPTGGA